ncbi:hypothetical protein B0A54_12267 [Friedmanniomyces endolithicus]|uniref:Uncharacterized protein n=1 Tax=Friedmanniomyces endolithicus TaxID=329885 RepID=A0A4U0UKZ5_9PEZI|nr:hypothetical protein LTS09_006161 [Friedmanniomyces endolithicus]TKA35822.1 hypothetical protein B0A54_12267 [Friedmanniomyces endolithicus]
MAPWAVLTAPPAILGKALAEGYDRIRDGHLRKFEFPHTLVHRSKTLQAWWGVIDTRRAPSSGEHHAKWFVDMGSKSVNKEAREGRDDEHAIPVAHTAHGIAEHKAPYVYMITEDVGSVTDGDTEEQEEEEMVTDDFAPALHEDDEHGITDGSGPILDEHDVENPDQIIILAAPPTTTKSTDPKMHSFPCVVPGCNKLSGRRMNRRTDLISHLIKQHKCRIHQARGGPADKTEYNRRQNKQVRDWMEQNGWSWDGTIFADGAEE